MSERCVQILAFKLDDVQHQAMKRSPEQVLDDLLASGLTGKPSGVAEPHSPHKKKRRTSEQSAVTTPRPSTPYSPYHSSCARDETVIKWNLPSYGFRRDLECCVVVGNNVPKTQK